MIKKLKVIKDDIIEYVMSNPFISSLTFLVIVLSISLFIINFKNNGLEKENLKLNKKNEEVIKKSDSIINRMELMKFKLDSLKKGIEKRNSFKEFLRDIAYRESSGIKDTVNKYGMMGLYQFDPNTLSLLGYCEEGYLNSVTKQNEAMLSYLKFNKKLLKSYINKYDEKYYDGIYITESGILAGAHLTGAGGVIEFFEKRGKYKTKDANNTHVSDYIREFSGYNLYDY